MFPPPGLWVVLTSCDYELQNVDVFNPYFLRDIDETSWKSLSGVRANKRILQLVPDLEVNVDFFMKKLFFLFGFSSFWVKGKIFLLDVFAIDDRYRMDARGC